MKSLRLVFLLLLLANAAVFAWQSGYLGQIDDGREPDRLDDQRAADQLKVIASKETEPSPAAAPADITPAGDSSSSVKAESSPAASAKSPALCQLVSGFKLAEAKQWVAAATAKAGDAKFSVSPVENPSRYEVLIAALAGQEGVDSKLKELKALGINLQPRTVSDGTDKLALVFASFPSEAEAKAYLQGLMDKGVKTARVVARYPATAMAQVEIRNLDPARLKEYKDQWSNRNDLRFVECASR